MVLRCVCWSIFLCLALGSTVKAQVTVDDQGYQNLLISIEPNVNYSKGKETIEKIQGLIRSTSSVLQKSIGIRIASATFILPPSWSTEKWKDINVTSASSAQTDRRPDIRVDATKDSPFGKQPITLQYGGCGVPGYQITLPVDFVENTEAYPKGKLLAREWLKYRYGVFDENGFPQNIHYPDYYRITGGSEIRFTECTNSKVTYIFRKTSNDDICDINEAINFGSCRTSVDEKSAANVTSSLMYFHKDLPKMEHICGKDGRPHNSLARNKQNALCNGRSIWDVVKSSDDFKTKQQKSENPDTGSIKFSYVQKGKPRFVELLENSDKLHEQLSNADAEEDFAFDAWIHDLSTEKEQLPIKIYAKIYFGGYPIKYANVSVVVKSSEQQEEKVVMLDDGGGDPDVTRYDGVYSGYFSNFLEAGDYQITLKINDAGGRAKIGKQDPSKGNVPCCGNEVVSNDYKVPAFNMEKHIMFKAKSKRPKDGYPPSKIVNLIVIPELSNVVSLMWFAPGGGKAVGYSIKVFKSREDAVTKFETNGRELDASSMRPKKPGDPGTPILFDIPLAPYEEGVTNYVAMRSWNEFNKQSEISNVAEFMNPKSIKGTTQVKPETTSEKVSTKPETTTEKVSSKPDPPTNSGKTVGIVLGVIFGLAALCALAYLGYYYFVKKPRQS